MVASAAAPAECSSWPARRPAVEAPEVKLPRLDSCVGTGAPGAAPGNLVGAQDQVFVDVMKWCLEAIYRRYNPARLDQVDFLLNKYRRAELDLIRVALSKYVLRLPELNYDQYGRYSRASIDEQKAVYSSILRDAQKELLGMEEHSVGDPAWPARASSQSLGHTFFQGLWSLVEKLRSGREAREPACSSAPAPPQRAPPRSARAARLEERCTKFQRMSPHEREASEDAALEYLLAFEW